MEGWKLVAMGAAVMLVGMAAGAAVHLDHTILVPAGYVPIGGGGMTGSSAWIGGVVLCRH